MSTIERIEWIDGELIIQALWIPYTMKWAVIYLKDENWETSWWRWHNVKWIFKDWANKWRAEWDRLKFVSSYLWISTHEALKWFEDTFNLENDWKPSKEKEEENKFLKMWDEMGAPTEQQVEYMKERGIDLSLLEGVYKNNNGKIGLPIRKLDSRISSIQSRNVWEKGYFLSPWWDSDWLFMEWIDFDKKALIVVEWWSDFWTIRQHTTNVAGLVNAWNIEQLRMIKHFQRNLGMKIFFIPDNDEAWQQAEEKMKEMWIVFSTFRLENYWVKDLNELVCSYWIWKEILKAISEESEKPLTNIMMAMNKLKINLTKWRIFIKEKVFDKYLRWFRRATTVLINWQSTWGKTSLSLYMLTNILKNTDEIVNYYSLETDVWEQLLAIMWFYYWVSEKELLANLDKYDINIFEDRLFIYDDMRSYKEITEHLKETKPWIFFLDFVQKLRIDGIRDETEKATFYAQEMQNFLIDLWHTTWITLSQVAMSNYNAPLIQRTPKNAWALLESSDVVINVGKDVDWAFKVGFYKCKGWVGWWKVFGTHFNAETKEYNIFDDGEMETIALNSPQRRF